MSETINNQIPLNTIIAPSLNDANYASGLNDVFTNINDNFSTLANRDFVKGESGTSVTIQENSFFNEDGSLNVLGKKLQYCINNLSNREDEYANIVTESGVEIGVFDYFNNNPGVLYMVYNTVNDVNTQVPVAMSSLYYVFLDGRYATAQIGNIDETQYTNIKDFSCVLVYDINEKSVIDNVEVNGGFRALTSAFPTIYYENGVGLCWKVNGNGTGIPVQGMPGRDGINSTLHIVKCNSVEVNNSIVSGEVTKIFKIYDGYCDITPEDITDLNNGAALILMPDNTTPTNGSNFYFGVLRSYTIEGDPIFNEETGEYEDNIITKLYAYCDQETVINYGIETEIFINAMKNINILDRGSDASSGMPGLFIPMKDEDPVTFEQPVHLLGATSITNTEGQTSDLKTDVIMTPICDINTLKVTGDRDDMGPGEGNLMVDKYLYVRVNHNSDIFNDYNINAGDAGVDINKLKKYDYVLKYKLATVIKKDVDENGVVNNYFNAFENNNYETGSRAFGRAYANVIVPENTQMQITPPSEAAVLNDNNVKYYKCVNDIFTGETTDNHLDTIPAAFRQRMNSNGTELGIYRWELCKEYAEYDVDELIAGAYNPETDSYENYTFENKFSVIYTTTVNPSVNTEFMWFNGMQLVKSSSELNIENEDKNNLGGWDFKDQKYIVYGWNNGPGNDQIFTFIKFVPMYDNDFYIKDDTALNVNYNVNITGDQINPNRNITVHGSVNCDNLSVYKLTATGEIQNIYTKEDITGESGIILGSITVNPGTNDEETKPAFTVSSNGLINTVDGMFVKFINCLNDSNIVKEHTILTDTIETRQVVSNELMINRSDNNGRLIFIGNIGDDENYRFGVEINDNNGIYVKRSTDANWIQTNVSAIDLNGNANVPILSNELPIIQSENASLIISNQPASSTQLCFDGALGRIDGVSPGNGVLNGNEINVETIDFDVVKNFNMHRISMEQSSVSSKNNYATGSRNSALSGYTKTTSLQSELSWSISPGEVGSFGSQSATNNQAAINGVKANYIDKVTIQRSLNEPNQKLGYGNFQLQFNTTYGCTIGVRGECSNGRWPVMHYDNSYIDICIILGFKSKGVEYVTKLGSQRFKIDYSTNNYANDGGYEWTGGQGGNYNNIWRNYRFYFRPSNMVIPPQYTALFNFIKLLYDSGTELTFYVVPNYKLYFIGQKNIWGNPKQIVSGISISSIQPLTQVMSLSATKQLIKTDETFKGIASTGFSAQYLTTTTNDSTSNVKTTTVCNDGIVTRVGNTTFGLGYCKNIVDHKNGGYNPVSSDNPSWAITKTKNNVPVLFYYDHSGQYYDTNKNPKTGGTDNIGYAKRMYAIPLSDIFEAIKTIRSSDLTKYGL